MQGKPRILFFLLVFFISLLCGGCATSRGTGELVSDIGNGTAEVRDNFDNLGTRQTELAISGQKLESGIAELERSIEAGERNNTDIAEIIRKIRSRKVDPALIEEWRNRRSQTDGSGQDPGGGDL
ncbi:hypothetical protein AGMMS49942_12960 [Spirochaetia bacterium]|nr:hypothetical protein AGMMS49942_12960 [Spirochaetia bacterium]